MLFIITLPVKMCFKINFVFLFLLHKGRTMIDFFVNWFSATQLLPGRNCDPDLAARLNYFLTADVAVVSPAAGAYLQRTPWLKEKNLHIMTIYFGQKFISQFRWSFGDCQDMANVRIALLHIVVELPQFGRRTAKDDDIVPY